MKDNGLLSEHGIGRNKSSKISCPDKSELKYANESSDHMSYFKAYAEPSVPKQGAPERPTDVPIVVPTPPIDATFPCCPGYEVLNKLVTKLVPIEEEHPIMLPHDNQGQGMRMAAVRSSQCAHCGGHSDQ